MAAACRQFPRTLPRRQFKEELEEGGVRTHPDPPTLFCSRWVPAETTADTTTRLWAHPAHATQRATTPARMASAHASAARGARRGALPPSPHPRASPGWMIAGGEAWRRAPRRASRGAHPSCLGLARRHAMGAQPAGARAPQRRRPTKENG